MLLMESHMSVVNVFPQLSSFLVEKLRWVTLYIWIIEISRYCRSCHSLTTCDKHCDRKGWDKFDKWQTPTNQINFIQPETSKHNLQSSISYTGWCLHGVYMTDTWYRISYFVHVILSASLPHTVLPSHRGR